MSDPIYTNLSFNLSGTIWLYILGFAIFANIIPHLFYYAGTLKVQSSIAGIILLLEPVSATLLAAIFLGQMLTWNIFIGGIFVLTANWIILRKS